jgi:hypothetical protein
VSQLARRKPSEEERRRRKPATSPEQRENQLVSLASDLAEEQIRGGTASSQVITHFLKLGSSRERLEQERLRHENELSKVKREAIEGQKRVEELYMSALDAMRSYSGANPVDDDVVED